MHHPKTGERDIPKTGPLSRLKNAPKDQIPISKAPRRQKSSRFYVKEKVQLEKTPGFHGKLLLRGDTSRSISDESVCDRGATASSTGTVHPKDSAMYGYLRFQRCLIGTSREGDQTADVARNPRVCEHEPRSADGSGLSRDCKYGMCGATDAAATSE